MFRDDLSTKLCMRFTECGNRQSLESVENAYNTFQNEEQWCGKFKCKSETRMGFLLALEVIDVGKPFWTRMSGVPGFRSAAPRRCALGTSRVVRRGLVVASGRGQP